MRLSDIYDGIDYVDPSTLSNLRDLLERLSELETLYGKPFIVTSGFRSRRKHREIYDALNKKRLLDGKDALPIPINSAHLNGNAADIHDPLKEIKIWVAGNPKVLEECELWCEQLASTPSWIHLQRVPPKSGARFFKPFT